MKPDRTDKGFKTTRAPIIGNCSRCGTIVERFSMNKNPFKCWTCRQDDKRENHRNWLVLNRDRKNQAIREKRAQLKADKQNATDPGTTLSS